VTETDGQLTGKFGAGIAVNKEKGENMLYKEDLDKMNCAMGHVTEGIWIHSKCHPQFTPGARYQNGVIVFRCSVCDKPVAEIAIARAIQVQPEKNKGGKNK